MSRRRRVIPSAVVIPNVDQVFPSTSLRTGRAGGLGDTPFSARRARPTPRRRSLDACGALPLPAAIDNRKIRIRRC